MILAKKQQVREIISNGFNGRSAPIISCLVELIKQFQLLIHHKAAPNGSIKTASSSIPELKIG
jgi:hypothetical protein